MKASVRWLRELLPELTLSAPEVAEKLTRAGLEVESIHSFGAATSGVFLARVEKREPHPSKGKLSLVTIDRGDAVQTVVCGAPNVPEPGGLVAYAPVGAHLPAKGLTLTPREIGGVMSEGMLCSEAELGLRDSDAGILILPPGAGTLGQSIAQVIPEAHDEILEIGLTPNRPDALGHVGLARELATLLGLPFSMPEPRRPAPIPTNATGTVDAILDALAPGFKHVANALTHERFTTEEQVKVSILDQERCPHYGAAFVRGVTVGPSPLWVTYRLEALGVRSISNVVDVTNLVMLLFGHPIHGFDFAKVKGAHITVRRASAGETMSTLDGQKRHLDPDDLVIADDGGAVALAGVMGGAGSELSDETRDILVECAYFQPRGVRRTSRRHGLHTESSHRFERGVDPGDTDAVLRYTAALLVELAGGASADTYPIFGAALHAPTPIRLREARIAGVLGIAVPRAEVLATLDRLGCTHRDTGDGTFEVTPPTHRPDLTIEEDLIEEVVRVHGVDRVPAVVPPISPQPPRPGGEVRARLRAAAIELGLSEALTFGFVSRKDLEVLKAEPPAFVLKNPLTEDRAVMRTSLLPGLLEAQSRAERHGVSNVRLFAMGARFLKSVDPTSRLADEARSLAVVLAGTRGTGLEKPAPLDVYDAKGIAVELVERATRRSVSVEGQVAGERAAHLHPRSAGDLVITGQKVGHFGELHPRIAKVLGLGQRSFVVELDVDALERIGARTPKFVPIPTLPASTRDLAVVVRDEIAAGSLIEAIRAAAGELCEEVEVFDLFRGAGIPDGHRSLAFHVVYRDPRSATDPERAKTLTDAEVDKRHAAVVSTIRDRFGATLRA